MSNNKYKILVVEDDSNISSMIQTVLETNGYQVLLAQKCRQGILMFTSHSRQVDTRQANRLTPMVAIPVVLSLPVSVKACRKLMEYPFGKKKA